MSGKMLELQGTHTHKPTGKEMTVNWTVVDNGTSAAWKYRLRYGGKVIDERDGTVEFDPAATHASAAAIQMIRAVLDEREAHYKI